jgi:hypothetical protein
MVFFMDSFSRPHKIISSLVKWLLHFRPRDGLVLRLLRHRRLEEHLVVQLRLRMRVDGRTDAIIIILRRGQAL